jgi:hypothetical protein
MNNLSGITDDCGLDHMHAAEMQVNIINAYTGFLDLRAAAVPRCRWFLSCIK